MVKIPRTLEFCTNLATVHIVDCIKTRKMIGGDVGSSQNVSIDSQRISICGNLTNGFHLLKIAQLHDSPIVQ